MLTTTLTLLPIFTSSMVINRITTTDDRELTYVSLAGGADIYISGVGLGTPFRPPTIFVGPTTCDVQSFTSSNTRIHCVLNGDLLPPPPDAYATSTTNPSYASGDAMSKAGDFRMLKLYAVPYGVTARQLREGGRQPVRLQKRRRVAPAPGLVPRAFQLRRRLGADPGALREPRLGVLGVERVEGFGPEVSDDLLGGGDADAGQSAAGEVPAHRLVVRGGDLLR